MFVEPDDFVVVTVEQAFAMQPCLVNQTRQMDITAEFLVRTAWMQSSHELIVAMWPAKVALRHRENWTPSGAIPQALVSRAVLLVPGRSVRWRVGRKTSRLSPR